MNPKEFTRKSAFISVEIAIKTNRESTAFVKWFEDQDNYVNKIEWQPEKWFIYCDPISGRDANSVIRKLCKMIEKFPPEVRKDWDRARHREFYAGYYGGDDPRCFEEHITFSTLQAAVSVKAAIGLAIYPAFPTDDQGFDEAFYKTIESEQTASSNH
jgi:hypothetical protein